MVGFPTKKKVRILVGKTCWFCSATKNAWFSLHFIVYDLWKGRKSFPFFRGFCLTMSWKYERKTHNFDILLNKIVGFLAQSRGFSPRVFPALPCCSNISRLQRGALLSAYVVGLYAISVHDENVQGWLDTSSYSQHLYGHSYLTLYTHPLTYTQGSMVNE